MSRKGKAITRTVAKDEVYGAELVTKLINKLMYDGKRGIAQNILYDAFDIIKKKTEKEPMDIFATALNNVMPNVELKVRRVGAANLQVPVEVSNKRKITLGIRWLVNYARLRNEKTMKDKLAGEIIDAANGTGASVKKREDVHKMAEANKAYAHYKW